MKTRTCEMTFEKQELFIEYEFEPALPATEIDPSWGPVYSVRSIYINGSQHDGLELIDPAVIHWIEAELASRGE